MKYIYSILGLTILLTGMIYFFRWRKVEFSFVRKVEIKDVGIAHDYNIAIFPDKDGLQSCLEIPPLKFYEAQELIKVRDFDFEKQEYVFSYGRELIEIKYNWYYVLIHDKYYTLFNSSNKRIPVKPVYKSNEIENAIYIYSLPIKNKYRGIL